MAKQILKVTTPVSPRRQDEDDSSYIKRLEGFFKEIEDELKSETNNEYHVIIVVDPDVNKTTVDLLSTSKPILVVTSYMYDMAANETERVYKNRIKKGEAELLKKYKKLTNDEYHIIIKDAESSPLEVLGAIGGVSYKEVVDK